MIKFADILFLAYDVLGVCTLYNLLRLLSPHADRHAGDISFTVFCLFACPQIFCNGYLRRGLTHDDEIWQDGRPGWVAGHFLFWRTLAQRLAPKAKK